MGTPSKFMPLFRMPRASTPKKAAMMLPLPPNRLAPPISAAEIDISGASDPSCTEAEFKRALVQMWFSFYARGACVCELLLLLLLWLFGSCLLLLYRARFAGWRTHAATAAAAAARARPPLYPNALAHSRANTRHTQTPQKDGTRGSSCGFEHVFVGEVEGGGDEVKGLHNWVQVGWGALLLVHEGVVFRVGVRAPRQAERWARSLRLRHQGRPASRPLTRKKFFIEERRSNADYRGFVTSRAAGQRAGAHSGTVDGAGECARPGRLARH